jgi:murein endopeptidase
VAAVIAAVLLAAAPAPVDEATTTLRPVHDRPVQPVPSRPLPPRARPAPAVRFAPIRWRRSRSVGLPWNGRLVGGVVLPEAGAGFYTWDPVLRRSPNRAGRRVGSDRLVRTLMRVLAKHHAAHPDAPRVGIGDLSRPNGGDFGVRFGRPGHVSHQNGLDVDVYYPRLDRWELPPRRVAQIDRRLAQDLVDRFVRAGARYVFVGPNTGLAGPPRVVQPLAHHDNHLHVRLR